MTQCHDLTSHSKNITPKSVRIQLDRTGFSSIKNKIILPSITIDTPGKFIEYPPTPYGVHSWEKLLVKSIKPRFRKYRIHFIININITMVHLNTKNTYLRVQEKPLTKIPSHTIAYFEFNKNIIKLHLEFESTYSWNHVVIISTPLWNLLPRKYDFIIKYFLGITFNVYLFIRLVILSSIDFYY